MSGPTSPMSKLEDLTEEEREVVLRVVDVLRKARFGTVLLLVHNGKVVQIEMAEKVGKHQDVEEVGAGSRPSASSRAAYRVHLAACHTRSGREEWVCRCHSGRMRF